MGPLLRLLLPVALFLSAVVAGGYGADGHVDVELEGLVDEMLSAAVERHGPGVTEAQVREMWTPESIRGLVDTTTTTSASSGDLLVGRAKGWRRRRRVVRRRRPRAVKIVIRTGKGWRRPSPRPVRPRPRPRPRPVRRRRRRTTTVRRPRCKSVSRVQETLIALGSKAYLGCARRMGLPVLAQTDEGEDNDDGDDVDDDEYQGDDGDLDDGDVDISSSEEGPDALVASDLPAAEGDDHLRQLEIAEHADLLASRRRRIVRRRRRVVRRRRRVIRRKSTRRSGSCAARGLSVIRSRYRRDAAYQRCVARALSGSLLETDEGETASFADAEGDDTLIASRKGWRRRRSRPRPRPRPRRRPRRRPSRPRPRPRPRRRAPVRGKGWRRPSRPRPRPRPRPVVKITLTRSKGWRRKKTRPVRRRRRIVRRRRRIVRRRRVRKTRPRPCARPNRSAGRAIARRIRSCMSAARRRAAVRPVVRRRRRVVRRRRRRTVVRPRPLPRMPRFRPLPRLRPVRRPRVVRRKTVVERRVIRRPTVSHTSSHSHTSTSSSSKSVNVNLRNVRAVSGLRQDIRDVTRGVLLDFFRARRMSTGAAFKPAPWSSMAPGEAPSGKVGDVYDPHSWGPGA